MKHTIMLLEVGVVIVVVTMSISGCWAKPTPQELVKKPDVESPAKAVTQNASRTSEEPVMHPIAEESARAEAEALARTEERVNLWKAWPGRDDNQQRMIEVFSAWVAQRNDDEQEFAKNRSSSETLPVHFEFRHLRNMVSRDVMDNLGDYLAYDPETQCLILTRYNEQRLLAEGAFLSLAQRPWRAIEFICYPNGSPHLMECFEDGQCKGLSVIWDESGKVIETVFDQVPAGDPRVYLSVTPDTPPSGLPGNGKKILETQTCVVRLSFAPKESTTNLPITWLLRYATQQGASLAVKAPEFTELTFAGWSGDISETSPQITVTMDQNKILIAHYTGEVRFADKALHTLVCESLGKPQGTITAEDALQLTQINASGKNIVDLSGIHWFKQLTSADFSGNKISDLSSMDAFLDANRWLVIPGLTAPGNPDASSWIKDLKYYPMNRLTCLANRFHCFELMEKLVLDDNPLPKLPDMFACMNLREFSANGCSLLEMEGGNAWPRLEILHLDKNELQNIPSFSLFPTLKEVWARDNRMNIIIPPTVSQKFTLHIEGNPLSDIFLSKLLPELQAKGVVVGMTTNSGVSDSDADPDKDGYPNGEEMRFAKLFFADEEKVNELYTKAIQDPAIPSRYLTLIPDSVKNAKTDPKSVASIPTSDVSIHIEGNGTVYPGPGEHSFAKYVIKDDLTWDSNQVTFTAKPGPGWALQVDTLMAQIGQSVNENGEITLSMDNHAIGLVRARFVQVGDTMDLDLVRDLESFLKVTGLSDDAYTFDRNEFNVSSDGVFFLPSGIPDAAEFKVMETVLKSPQIGASHGTGIRHDEAVKAWRENLALARRDLGDNSDVPGAVNTLAAYATLGNYASTEFIKQTLNRLYNLKINMGKYNNALMEELDPDRSAANTTITNKEHWDRISRGKSITKELLGEYAQAVLEEER